MARLVLSSALVLILSACGAQGDCDTDSGCEAEGSVCIAGACTDATLVDDEGSGDVCVDDADCNINAGEVCMGGVCLADDDPRAPEAGADCAVTADCPLNKYCSTETLSCQPLEAGMCREAAHCSTNAPVCTAQTSSVRGQCVQCMSHTDCPSGVCQ